MDYYFHRLINEGGSLCIIQRLKAKCDEALSNFAFNFNLRRYTGGLRKTVLVNWYDKKSSTSRFCKCRTVGRCWLTLLTPKLTL